MPMHNFSGPSRLPRYPGVGDCCGYLVSSWWQPRRRLTQLMAVTVPAVALAPQSPTFLPGRQPLGQQPRCRGCRGVLKLLLLQRLLDPAACEALTAAAAASVAPQCRCVVLLGVVARRTGMGAWRSLRISATYLDHRDLAVALAFGIAGVGRGP